MRRLLIFLVFAELAFASHLGNNPDAADHKTLQDLGSFLAESPRIILSESAGGEVTVKAVNLAQQFNLSSSLSNEFYDEQKENLIIAGTACDNAAIRYLLGIKDCSTFLQNGVLLKLVTQPFNKYSLFIIGSTEADVALGLDQISKYELLSNAFTSELLITGSSGQLNYLNIQEPQILRQAGSIFFSLSLDLVLPYSIQNNFMYSEKIFSITNQIRPMEMQIVLADPPPSAVSIYFQGEKVGQFSVNAPGFLDISQLVLQTSIPAEALFITPGPITLSQRFDLLDGNASVGSLVITSRFDELPQNLSANVYEGSSNFGSLNFVSDVILEQSSREYNRLNLKGNVTFQDGTPLYYGLLSAQVRDDFFTTIVRNGFYELSLIAQPQEEVTINIQGETFRRYFPSRSSMFDINLSQSSTNFPDKDLDGIPDYSDRCQDSNSTIVDVNGCSCSQKNCPGMSCEQSVLAEAVCRPTCYDGYVNQGEKSVDCGGLCMPCCTQINSCLSDKPSFCNINRRTIFNCQKCGCPDSYSCENDGQCYREVPQEGILCKVAGVKLDYYPHDCSKYGESWVREDHMPYLRVKGHGLFGEDAEDDVKHKLRKMTVCIDTRRACVSPGQECPMEGTFEEYKPVIQNIVQRIINGEIRKAKSRLNLFEDVLADITGTDVSVHFNLDNFKIRENFPCAPLKVTPAGACKQLINNGPSQNKIDLLFVGDGYYDEKEFLSTLRKALDYSGLGEGTKDEGLFSIEPFKSNKKKFNVWYSFGVRIPLEQNPIQSYDDIPQVDKLAEIASACPVNDYVLVISRSSYRSFCFLKTGPCFNSAVFEPFLGRLILHEFGHGFAGLEDEYHNNVEMLDPVIDAFYSEFSTNGPNCKPNRASAEAAWESLVDEKVSYFEGCGGDCGETCKTNIRPTANSIMNAQRLNAIKPDCLTDLRKRYTPDCQGPPFEPYFSVNEREIRQVLETYPGLS